MRSMRSADSSDGQNLPCSMAMDTVK